MIRAASSRSASDSFRDSAFARVAGTLSRMLAGLRAFLNVLSLDVLFPILRSVVKPFLDLIRNTCDCAFSAPLYVPAFDFFRTHRIRTDSHLAAFPSVQDVLHTLSQNKLGILVVGLLVSIYAHFHGGALFVL